MHLYCKAVEVWGKGSCLTIPALCHILLIIMNVMSGYGPISAHISTPSILFCAKTGSMKKFNTG